MSNERAGREALRIGFIGGGMMAQIGHLPFYRDDPRCEVAVIAETRPSLVDVLGQAYPSARIVADPAEVFADPAVDTVLVSVPRAATAPLVDSALRAGKRVLSEKPMAHTLDQARRLADLADQRGVHYSIGFMKRYDPGVQRCRTLLAAITGTGRLGRLLLVHAWNHSREYAVPPPAHTRPRESRTVRFPTWPCHPDWLPSQWHDGYAWFMNANCHDVNLLRFLLGDDLRVCGARATTEGTMMAHLALGDVPVSLITSRAATGLWDEGVELVFEQGRVELRMASPMATDETARVRVEERGRPAEDLAIPSSRWAFAAQAAAFIDALATGQDSLTSGRDSVADLVLVEDLWRHIMASAR